MKFQRFLAASASAAAVLCVAAVTISSALAKAAEGQPAKAIITVMPKNAELAPPILPQDLKVQVNGKSAQIDHVTPLRGSGLELVILIDSGVRTSLGRQLGEISDFVKSLPPTTQVAIAYMMNGRALFEQPFTADKAQAVKSLHIPAGSPGSSASPYFCISDLAKNWPSKNPSNRREVIAITDGIDPYQVHFDPADPYLQAATNDSIRAGIIVDALYWHDAGLASRYGFLANGGQSLLAILTGDTGGRLYYQGLSNPVSFIPYFDELRKRFENQYELGFYAQGRKKPEVQSLKIKLQMPGVKLDAPNLVLVPAAN
jgi:hypothetical protein